MAERGGDRRAVRVRVGGRVQGVGFRWFVLRAAETEGVAGWVRNRDDGDVEIVAEGPPGSLAAFLDAVRTGPAGARVARFEAREIEPDAAERRFRVIP